MKSQQKYWRVLALALLIPLIIPSYMLGSVAQLKVGLVDLDLDNSEEEPYLLYLEQAASRLNVQLELISLPDARSHHLAEMGQLDAEAFPYELDSRQAPNMLKVNVPMERSELWIWVTQHGRCPDDRDQLKQFKPVGTSGIPYFKMFYQLSEVGHAKVHYPELMLEMLMRGRADYFAASKKTVSYLYNDQRHTELKTCFDKPYLEIQSFFYLDKHYQHLVKPFEEALSELIRSNPDER